VIEICVIANLACEILKFCKNGEMYKFHQKGQGCPQTVLELEIKWKNRTTLVTKKQMRATARQKRAFL
jgi:hypothetical protein